VHSAGCCKCPAKAWAPYVDYHFWLALLHTLVPVSLNHAQPHLPTGFRHLHAMCVAQWEVLHMVLGDGSFRQLLTLGTVPHECLHQLAQVAAVGPEALGQHPSLLNLMGALLGQMPKVRCCALSAVPCDGIYTEC